MSRLTKDVRNNDLVMPYPHLLCYISLIVDLSEEISAPIASRYNDLLEAMISDLRVLQYTKMINV